ncbi:MAG: tyrosine-type recombinase/integrase [Candidatus Micrarchaeota archaeon]
MKNGRLELYDYPRRLELSLQQLSKQKGIGKENIEEIKAFANIRLAKGSGHGRVAKVIYCLRFLAIWLQKPFKEATKDDLINLIGSLETKDYAEHTKYDFKIVLKMFYKWLKGNDEIFPPEIRWLTPKLKNENHKLPEHLLTEDEVLKMAEMATTQRDRAFITVLYESGCRIGEILSLRMKNVSFDQYGAVLRVTGKTGDRRVRIIMAAPILTSWIDIHPARKDPEAALWPQSATNYSDKNRYLRYASIYVLVKTLAEKAGIRKRVHPHLFRHSRATALANKLTESQMKEHFGWTQGSDMASTYVHLSGRDVDNALLQVYSLKEKTEEKEVKLNIKTCLRCKEKNSPVQSFCGKCGNPLDEKTLLIDPNKKPNELMNILIEDEEVKNLLLKKIVEKGLDKTFF